jgi:prevent-host-death family protein
MVRYPVHAAKTHLSRLIEQALAGEEVVISRGAVPVVRLVPVEPPPRERRPGSWRGRLVVGPEFFEPLPDDVLDDWEGR